MIRTIFILTFFSSIHFGCSNSQNDQPALDPSLVNNPISADEKVDKSKLPVMTFEKKIHDFKTIKQGEKVNYSFKFTNTGKGALIINNASASCGCTVPKVPTKPILPGESDYIEVTFDSSNKGGKVEKVITIVANTIPSTNDIRIVADITGY